MSAKKISYAVLAIVRGFVYIYVILGIKHP